jgi:hypothetical protein
MPGLLDFFNSPANMAMLGTAAGLLQAGGPSRTPVGFGQAIGSGLLQGAQMGQGTAHTQLTQAYLGEQLKQMQNANAKQAQLAPILQQFASRLNAGQQPAGTASPPTGVSDSSAASIGAPWAAVSQIPQQAPSQATQGLPFSLEDITLLKMIGGPDLTSAYTASRPNLAVEGGFLLDRHRGVQGSVPQTNQQGFSTMTVQDPNTPGGFRVQTVPGAAEAYGQQQRIAHESAANFQPFMGVTDSQGRPIPMTQGSFARSFGGMTATPGGGQVPSGAPRGVGQTPAQRVTAEESARGDVGRVQALEQKIPNMLSVQRRLTRMEALTKDDQTYAAAGAELKSTLGSISQAFGLKVNESKTANTEEYLAHVAELLKDRLASKDYGSGTGISNLDILAAQKPLPELAKTAAGRLQLISALKSDTERGLRDAQAARDFFDANQSLRGFRFPSEMEAEQRPPIPKTPGQTPANVKILKYNPVTKRIE